MRLFLLPISTRRTLLYCQRLNTRPAESKSLIDKATSRAAKTWAEWEKKDQGWQKTVVNYGNYAFRRIPYEEWGLKSVPPLSAKRREDGLQGKDMAEIVYPQTIIPTTKVTKVLETLGTERQSFHRSRLIWCLVGIPLTTPFTLVPIIPNFPFFYLVYRAWSHWRAMAGGKHIQFLLANNLLTLSPSSILDNIYMPHVPSSISTKASNSSSFEEELSEKPLPSDRPASEADQMLLSQSRGRELVKALEIPELEVEIERAIWQVETANQKAQQEKAGNAAQNSSSTPQDKKD